MLPRNCNCYVALWLFLTWIVSVDSTMVERSATEKSRIRCSEPDGILHGYYKKNRRNSNMRAHCNDGYSLLGSRVVPCINGKWTGERPICVKKGCSFLTQNPPNGRVQVESQFKLALFCSDNYILAGNRFTYCNGTHWDRPLGTCRKIFNRVSHECDFETEDNCGWVVDQTDSFEWKRVTAMNVFTSFRTGPRHDHTTMSTSGGHYMLMESLGNVTAPATLSSPIYDRELSLKTACCFRFYYFMYGSGVGDLYVLVKPVSVTLPQALEQKSKYLKFNKTGNQNNLWNEAHFSIDEMDEDFQIIFVAGGAKSHLSDIAIDDVKLMTGSECKILQKLEEDSDDSSELEATTEETIFDTQSCVSRCGRTGTGILRQDGTLFGLCSCNFECILENDCCPDFVTVCLDDYFAASTWWADNGFVGSVDQQSTIVWEATTDTTEKTTTTTTKATTTTTTTTRKPSTTTTTTTTTTTRKPTTTSKPTTTTTTTTTTRKPTTIATTKRRTTPTTTTTTTTQQPTTKTTRSTTVTTTTPKTTTQKVEVTTNSTKLLPTAAPGRPVKDKGQSNATNRTFTWQNKSQFDDSQQRGPHEANILLIIFGVICVSIAVATTYLRRRKIVAAWMGKHFKNGNDTSAVEDSTSIIANFSHYETPANGSSATSQMVFSKSSSKKPKRPGGGNDSHSSSNDECYGDSDEIPLV